MDAVAVGVGVAERNDGVAVGVGAEVKESGEAAIEIVEHGVADFAEAVGQSGGELPSR